MSLILRQLWRRKTRSLLTVLGIAVGVAAVIALSAFGEGLASGFEQLSSSSGADLTVAQKDAVMTIDPLRKVTKTKGAFPTDEAARKLLLMVNRDVTGKWTAPVANWARIRNQLAIRFTGRCPM